MLYYVQYQCTKRTSESFWEKVKLFMTGGKQLGEITSKIGCL
jgi:hypothetical protein